MILIIQPISLIYIKRKAYIKSELHIKTLLKKLLLNDPLVEFTESSNDFILSE